MRLWLLIISLAFLPLPAPGSGSGASAAQTGACDEVGGPDADFLGAVLEGQEELAGPTRMCGLDGDDAYDYDDVGDFAVERRDQGVDTINYLIEPLAALPPHVERAILTAGVTAAQGNDLDNELIGNGADNHLDGAAGDDVLHSGRGNDTLTGGGGEDTAILPYHRAECEFAENECRDWAVRCGYNTVRATGIETIRLIDCEGPSTAVVDGSACE